ncbi:hypothetical protein [Sphaerisporangium perillae]|uniref:hypothetical protein n=1 Tax=Sphaerisporangium perillae TaxID=2935860 RepID=UPI00200ED588|nr:hypothetical protein [Sphaerisporangium perillae]
MTTGPGGTADQLRDVFETLASGVHADPDAYRRVQAEWRRRERRRRLVLAVLVALVFTLADVAGLWALNQARNQPHIVFNDPAPTRSYTSPAGR